MFCSNCGKEVNGEWKFCNHCGNILNSNIENIKNDTNGNVLVNSICRVCGKETKVNEHGTCEECIKETLGKLEKKEEKINKNEEYNNRDVLKDTKQNTMGKMIFGFLLVCVIIAMVLSSSNNNNSNIYNSEKSIIDTYNLSSEVKEQIKINWNKISGYGTSNIEKVILDVTRGWLYIVYTDTANNGLYVYSDASSGYHYGNEKATTGSYRDEEEKMFSIWLNTWSEQYKKLTKSEFINLLNEL